MYSESHNDPDTSGKKMYSKNRKKGLVLSATMRERFPVLKKQEVKRGVKFYVKIREDEAGLREKEQGGGGGKVGAKTCRSMSTPEEPKPKLASGVRSDAEVGKWEVFRYFLSFLLRYNVFSVCVPK
jgi:hypothetical protein